MANLTESRATELGAAPRMRPRSAALEARSWRHLTLLAAIGILWVVFHQLTDGVVFTPRNLTNLSVQTSVTAMIAVGMTWLIIAREIDLSVGSLVALVSVATVWVQVKSGWNAYTAVALGLGIGIAVGAFQGFCSAKLKIPSFIVTLAGFTWLRGAAYVSSGGLAVAGTNSDFLMIGGGNLSKDITLAIGAVTCIVGAFFWMKSNGLFHWREGGVGSSLRPVNVLAMLALAGALGVALWAFASYRGLPIPVALLAVVSFVAVFVSRHTAFGRHIYAIGGNPEAARRSGVNVDGVVIVLFVIVGFLTGLGGIIQASILDSGTPDIAVFLALDAISAVIIGGTSFFGGYGSVAGTLLGALFLQSISNGLSLMGVNTFYQFIATGLILLAAVGLDSLTQRRLRRD